MSMSPTEITRWARALAAARRDRVLCEPLTASVDLTLDDAYAIQRAGTAMRLGRGETIVGWKLGYTSLAMRTQMGIDAPNFAPLTDAMLLTDDARADPHLIQPRVEPEIGLRFGARVPPGIDLRGVLAAVSDAFACLEIVDSVYPGYRFRLEDNTADGSSAAQVVVGPALGDVQRLADVTVELCRNDSERLSATGSAASSHPAAGVVWLVRQLAEQGLMIEPGQIVITGGLTSAVPLNPGDRVEAVFDRSARVVVTR